VPDALLATAAGVVSTFCGGLDMATVSIPLGSRKYPGLFAIVDEEDYPLVSQYRWSPRKAKHTWYAGTVMRDDDYEWMHVMMHRFILGLSPEVLCDHNDGNGLNNRRNNLRPATSGQNAMNRRVRSNNTSGYRGVTWYQATRKWNASLMCHGKRHHLGYFTDKVAAARAYDEAAVAFFGAFARLNFPKDSS
jgi:hypothetical protein